MRGPATLSDLGEFGLIERIERQARRLQSAPVVLGIGDDAAVLRPRASEDLVASSDSRVEDVHFRWRTQSSVVVGRTALAVNLSDLAAMGARPLGFTCALQAPGDLPLARFDGLVRGLLAEAARHGCPLVGGNLARARETSIAITVLGAVARGRALRRDALRPGDRLFVTGVLGAAALALARSEKAGSPLRRVPFPRLAAGLGLVRHPHRGACIDVSDGLWQDAGHLARASDLGLEIDASRVPRPRGFAAACARLGLDPESACLAGGEDYELLFSLRAAHRGSLGALSRRLGVAVSEIGRVVEQPGVHGIGPTSAGPGWRHF